MGNLYNIFRKKDHIVYLKGTLSQEDCKTAIDYFEEHKELQYAGRLNGKLKPRLKSDTEICFTIEKDKPPCPVLNPFFKALNGGVDQYIKEYPYIDKLPNVWRLYSDIKIQRYNPGEGYFALHCENEGFNLRYPDTASRVLAWMIYLNDVKDGGYTEFPSQGKKFQPRRGDLLMWPAYFTHPHRGSVSKTQTKYITTGWYNFVPEG